MRAKEFMKYYNIWFKKTKAHQKDRDSLDLMKSCSENYTEVVDSKKFSGADFLKGMNTLKYKQNNQIDRLVKAVEAQFSSVDKGLELSENSFTKVSSILNSKFLSDDSTSGDRNLQRQSVISVQMDKPHFVKIMNSKLFTKISLEDYLRPELPSDKSILLQVRK